VLRGLGWIDWKYHQYLALLFTELFLDQYFDDAGALRDEINTRIAEHNAEAIEPDQVAPFPTEPVGNDDADPRRQLARLAFWCATGSGKTLLMHVHVRQFRQYHQRAFSAGTWPKLDQIILVTPNDGLGQNLLATWSQWGGRWRTVPFGGHLYQPLLHVEKNAEIRISPVALDKWEAEFVQDLATWCVANRGREVYLLRNQAVTGLGFFQAANFFPDFLLWVQEGERQHLAFVDPKGLHHFDPSDPKVQFATREVPRLQQIVERQAPDMQLHAFILSNTPFASLGWSRGVGQLMFKAVVEQLDVLFQVDDAATYVGALMNSIRMPSNTPGSPPTAQR
jgi:hypothetical protein